MFRISNTIWCGQGTIMDLNNRLEGGHNTGRQLRLDIEPAHSPSVSVKINGFWNILDQPKFLSLEVLELSKSGVGG
jgi:hypothetical protein